MEKQQATDFVLERLGKKQPRDEIVRELCAALKAPENLISRFVDEIIAEYAVAPFKAEADFDEQALSDFVVNAIANLRDSDDILYDICMRTGWNWQKAHDFLIDMQASRLGEISKRQNRLILPLGVVIFIAGAVLTYITGSNIWNEYHSITSQGTLRLSVPLQLTALLTNHSWALLLGIALLVGGAYGVGKALAQPAIRE